MLKTGLTAPGVTRPNDIYSQFQKGYKPGKGQANTDTIFRDQYLKKPNSPQQQDDSLIYKYNNQTIFPAGKYFQKGTAQLTHKDLDGEFDMSPAGKELYILSKKQKTKATVFSLASTGLLFTGLAILSNNQNNKGIAYGTIGTYIVTSIVGIRFSFLSKKSLDLALWQRNKDVLFPAH